MEIGEQGFTPGTGSTYNTSSDYFEFQNLNPQTNYNIYIQSKCGTSDFGTVVGPTTITTQSSCTTPENLHIGGVSTCEFTVNWSGVNETAWEVEYGESGFSLGTGTVINTSDTYFTLTDNILPNTTYEVYVRANCGSAGYSNYTNALVITTETMTSLDATFLEGDYLIESITDGAFTAGGQGPIVGEQYVYITAGSNNGRYFNFTYYPDAFLNDTYFEFQLTNSGLVEVGINDTLSYSCDQGATTSIILGPSNQDQPYNVCDDSVLEFTFFELYHGTGGCGASDLPITIRLTKQ
ncbi:hypothetical protein FG167_01020 [Lacinutrix sp. WUR7]|uniref:fibronectin type III domain-containing protein n=1 Tax=Lacinutrix sp. WUR7 TaxID=2653681 RepID=UPI00193CF381|nr:fibronectin type III domain-containing protein [Lacinutrix sp. WUR7]QRM87859.1 hypothetical protein FG167_01020 [Lacinutrix sp. WUR7]